MIQQQKWVLEPIVRKEMIMELSVADFDFLLQILSFGSQILVFDSQILD